MPGFDGKGPRREGSMTGRGMGFCVLKLDSNNIEIGKIGKGVFNMPRGDGTGPVGLGPRTGRAAGFCSGYSMPGYANPGFGRGYSVREAGFYGRGGGMGRRNRYYATGLFGWQRASIGMPAFGRAYPYKAEIAPDQEASFLKNEAEFLKKQLEDIQSRIETLDKAQAAD